MRQICNCCSRATNILRNSCKKRI